MSNINLTPSPASAPTPKMPSPSSVPPLLVEKLIDAVSECQRQNADLKALNERLPQRLTDYLANSFVEVTALRKELSSHRNEMCATVPTPPEHPAPAPFRIPDWLIILLVAIFGLQLAALLEILHLLSKLVGGNA